MRTDRQKSDGQIDSDVLPTLAAFYVLSLQNTERGQKRESKK